ncbi:MAG: hydroxyacid dehydrogenase [Bacteroidetes bacterium]|nr:hydroxyacid dehydrogenase [Bacteroidota bacterium]MCA6444053.1 hydroxyacid dehydrogenase [Bacteroidota bacterium]
MKILLADKNHEILEHILAENQLQYDALWNLSADELIKILPQYDGLVIRSKFKLTKTILSQCNKLKVIGRVGAGMENIDVAFANKQKIICLSAPEGNRTAVGEHALGMLLMLLNNLKKADTEVRAGIWLRAENRGYEMEGKTIVIIGYGQMGSSFAEKLRGFNMKVLALDKYKNNYGNEFVTEAELGTIFNEADIVSLHLPLTEETYHYANEHFFNSFKKPIYIVNTARGKCLQTSALVEAMKSGKVKGACIDVLEYESTSFEEIDFSELPEDYRYLLNSDKVILTPHIAGWTHESNYKMSKIIAEGIVKYLANR